MKRFNSCQLHQFLTSVLLLEAYLEAYLSVRFQVILCTVSKIHKLVNNINFI